jgi:hypothetical protein
MLAGGKQASQAKPAISANHKPERGTRIEGSAEADRCGRRRRERLGVGQVTTEEGSGSYEGSKGEALAAKTPLVPSLYWAKGQQKPSLDIQRQLTRGMTYWDVSRISKIKSRLPITLAG